MENNDELGDLMQIHHAITSKVLMEITEEELRAFASMYFTIIKHPSTPQTVVKSGKTIFDVIVRTMCRTRPALMFKVMPNLPAHMFAQIDAVLDKTLTLNEVIHIYTTMKDLSNNTNLMVASLPLKEYADTESQSKILSGIKTNIAAGRDLLEKIDSQTFAGYLGSIENTSFGDIIEFTVPS